MFLRSLIICVFAGVIVAQQPSPNSSASAQFEIRGVIVDAVNGQPLSRATVSIAPVTKRDDITVMTTGEDGRFRFRNLARNKYSLSAQRRGYATHAYDQHETFSSSIAVGPSIDSSNIVFRLAPECSISGIVVDEAGEPVAGGQVILFRTGVEGGMNRTRQVRQVQSDDRGSYHFGHLLPGKFLVAVSAQVWYAQRPKPRQPVIQTTLSGESKNQYSWQQTFGGMTGGVGSLQSKDPEDDVSLPLDVVYPITFYPGSTEPGSAAPIVLNPGDRFAADINLQPVPATHFFIPNDGIATHQNRYLTLQRKLFDGSSLPVITETRIDASGTMEVVGIPPGHFTEKIIEPDKSQQDGPTHDIDVTDGATVQQADVPAAHVAVSLQLDAGTPRPTQSYLQLFNPKTRDFFNQLVSERGEIEFQQPIPPGAYELWLSNSGGSYIRSIIATGAKASGRTIQIRGSGAVALRVAIGQGQGRVTGTVLRDGKAFAGAMVLLVPSDPGNNAILVRRDQSDSDGTFTFGFAVPGKYTAVAIDNGWELEWLNQSVLKPYLAQGTPVDVQPNGKYDIQVTAQ